MITETQANAGVMYHVEVHAKCALCVFVHMFEFAHTRIGISQRPKDVASRAVTPGSRG